MNTGLEGHYVIKNNKKLKFGYTTGSCAAGAAKAATELLLGDPDDAYRDFPDYPEALTVELQTPKGILLTLEVLDVRRTGESVSCGVRKMAGDDPDVTDQAIVCAKVEKTGRKEAQNLADVFAHHDASESETTPETIENGDIASENTDAVIGITGGIGVGIVTLPGLEQPIGAPAINKVPRAMIREAVLSIARKYGYTGGLKVTISVPEGEELAKRTFNPRLGILDGISILGTTGIVEPMSEKALIASIELEMRQKAASKGDYLLITPGNYGTEYLRGNFPFPHDAAVKCSNYVGQTIDYAVNLELKGILFVAHIGKFVKLAGGIMNTHSHDADARMEILASCALRAGADADMAREILDAVTTDEGLRVLKGTPYWEPTLQILMEKIGYYLNFRCQGRVMTGAIVFSNVYGELGRTEHADQLLEQLMAQERNR